MSKGKSSSQSSSRVSDRKRLESIYLRALKAYWAYDFELAKAQIIIGLDTTNDLDTRFCLYRLWIGILAHQEDWLGLELLADHLLEFTHASGVSAQVFVSLVTLVYLELDQLEKAELFFRTIKNSSKQVYLEECRLRILFRKSGGVANRILSNYAEFLYDYIQFEFVVGLAVHANYKALVQKTQLKLHNIYPDSPLGKLVDVINFIRNEDFLSAHQISNTLLHKYPNNTLLHQFYLALSCQIGGHKVDQDISDGITHYSRNPDVLALAGLNRFRLRRQFNNSQSQDLGASDLVDRSIELSRKEGKVTPVISYQILAAEKKESEVEFRSRSNIWLVSLSNREFLEMRTDRLKFDTIRRPMGGSVAKGDICIFVCEDKMRKDISDCWRLAAIYTVIDHPQWHPLHRFESILKKDFMPEVAIPLECSFVKTDLNRKKYPYGDTRRYGIHHLDSQGLTSIENQLQEFSEEYSSYSEAFFSVKNAL